MSEQSYLWPHIDLGKLQVCAKFLFGNDMYKYKHGETVEWEDKNVLEGIGIKYSQTPIKHKGMFRITDKDYDKTWLKENLPNLKAQWKQLTRYSLHLVHT